MQRFENAKQEVPKQQETIPISLVDISPNDIASKLDYERGNYPKGLSNNPYVANLQQFTYEFCGINPDTSMNSGSKKLLKGCLDGAIFNKIEFLETLKNLTKEQIKNVIEYIIKNIDTLLREAIGSIPNFFTEMLNKGSYEVGVLLAENLPTHKVLSMASFTFGAAFKLAEKYKGFGRLAGAERENKLKDYVRDFIAKPKEEYDGLVRNLQPSRDHGDFENHIAQIISAYSENTSLAAKKNTVTSYMGLLSSKIGTEISPEDFRLLKQFNAHLERMESQKIH